MKSIISIFVCTYSIMVGCDPPRSQMKPIDKVTVKCQISDTNEVMFVGDTLSLYIKLPTHAESGNGNIAIQSISSGSALFLDVLQVDTLLKAARFVSHLNSSSPIVSFMTKGSIEPSTYNLLFSSGMPYEVEIKFVAKQKGVYYFEVPPQPGLLGYNGNRTAGVYTNFNVFNKHYDLLKMYFGQAFIDAITERDRNGFGTYAFRVQ